MLSAADIVAVNYHHGDAGRIHGLRCWKCHRYWCTNKNGKVVAAQICFYFHPDPRGNDPIWLFQTGWFNHQLEKVVLKSLKHLPKISKILMQGSHPIDFITLKTSPSFLQASYMFPFLIVGVFLKYHPLRKGRGREKQMGSSSTNPELSCNRRVEVAPAAWRGALQWCGHAPLQRLRRAQGGSERQRRRCGWRGRDENTGITGLLPPKTFPKLTWKLKIIHLKRKLIFRTFVFGVPC